MNSGQGNGLAWCAPIIFQIGKLADLFLTQPQEEGRGEEAVCNHGHHRQKWGRKQVVSSSFFGEFLYLGNPEPDDFSKLELDSSRGNFSCADSNFEVI